MATGSTQCIGDEVAQKVTDPALLAHHAAGIDPQVEPLDAVFGATATHVAIGSKSALWSFWRDCEPVLNDRQRLKFCRVHLVIFASVS